MRRDGLCSAVLIFALVVGALTPATGYTLPNSAPTCANAAIEGASITAIGSAVQSPDG
jgi:hypothetical protein